MKTRITLALAVSMLCAWGLARAGEHPSEHPAEHPKEHSKEHSRATLPVAPGGITMADLEKAILKSKSGTTSIYDPVAKKKLNLTLVRVHRDRLSRVSEGLYFACSDFKTPDGKIYDLDVFMKGDSPENLVETEVAIHKEAGLPRYTWVEKDGLWSKAPVKKKG